METPEELVRKERLDYAERKTDELMKHHLEDMAILTREAHATFAFLTVASSATFGYLLKLFDPSLALAQQKNPGWLVAVAILTVYLIGVTGILVCKAMMARAVQTPGNKPQTFIGSTALYPECFEQLRHAELLSMAERIDFNSQRNQRTGAVVNRVRLAIVAAPLVFTAAWAVAAKVLG